MYRLWKTVFITLTAAILLIMGSWLVTNHLQADAQKQLEKSLSTVLNTTHEAVRILLKEYKLATKSWANTPKVRTITATLLNEKHNRTSLVSSAEQTILRHWLRPVIGSTGYFGYFLIGPDNINLASNHDDNIGIASPLVEQGNFLERIRAGETTVSLPIPSDTILHTQQHGELPIGTATMFVGTPVYDEFGQVSAVFAFRLDPTNISKILKRGRIGNSGETYAFNGSGTLISESRFQQHLWDIRLLPQATQAIFNLQLRDPGYLISADNLPPTSTKEKPLTLMAFQATTTLQPDINVTGYRDYRGIPVAGSWLWDKEYRFGLTTEIDIDEAYTHLNQTIHFVISLTLLSIFLLVGLSTLFSIWRTRLLANKQQFRQIIDLVPSIILVRDAQGRLLIVNEATAHAFDKPIKELLGNTVSSLSNSAELINISPEIVQDIIQQGKTQYIKELPYKNKQNETRIAELTRMPFYFSGKEVDSILTVATDISESKMAEQKLIHYKSELEQLVKQRTLQLSESEERLKISQQIARVGTWDWDITNNNVIWSEELFDLLEEDPQHCKPSFESLLKKVHSEDRDDVKQQITHALENNLSYRIEYRLTTPNSNTRYVCEKGRIDRNDQRQPIRLIGVIVDITEQKKLEQMKDEFISVISHELRTPVTSIRGAMGLIAGRALDLNSPQASSLVDIALRNCERLVGLVNDLLDMEKLTAGKMKLNLETHEIAQLVASSVQENQPFAEHYQVTYIVENPCYPGSAKIDAIRFMQIMANLLSNAAKFSPADSVVTIRVLKNHDRIRVAVEDHGLGIPEKFHCKIFEKFQQADSSSTRQKGGTGLGLSICKALVERMDGHIDFQTEVNKGTTFFFDLTEVKDEQINEKKLANDRG